MITTCSVLFFSPPQAKYNRLNDKKNSITETAACYDTNRKMIVQIINKTRQCVKWKYKGDRSTDHPERGSSAVTVKLSTSPRRRVVTFSYLVFWQGRDARTESYAVKYAVKDVRAYERHVCATISCHLPTRHDKSTILWTNYVNQSNLCNEVAIRESSTSCRSTSKLATLMK